MFKDKFRYLIKQDSEKKIILRKLASCIVEKFNGSDVVRVELRQSFSTIDIIYKSVQKCDEIINCYYSEKLNAAFQGIYNEGKKIRHYSAW